MKKLSILDPATISLLAASFPAFAHHSFQAEYDQSKPLTLVGKVTKVLNDNPHGWIYLDAKNEQGRVVNWALEMPAPNVLRRNGYDRSIFETLIASGEDVTVTAYAAKDGSKHAWAGRPDESRRRHRDYDRRDSSPGRRSWRTARPAIDPITHEDSGVYAGSIIQEAVWKR